MSTCAQSTCPSIPGLICTHNFPKSRDQGYEPGQHNRRAAERALWNHYHALKRQTQRGCQPLTMPIHYQPSAQEGNRHSWSVLRINQTRPAQGRSSSMNSEERLLFWSTGRLPALLALFRSWWAGHTSSQTPVSKENQRNQRQYILECWNESSTVNLSPVTTISLWAILFNLYKLLLFQEIAHANTLFTLQARIVLRMKEVQ